jgi:hypothetical protein
LQKLVRGYVGTKSFGVPELAHKCTKTQDQLRCTWLWKLVEEKVIADGKDMGKSLSHDVQIVVGLDIVHTNKACRYIN